MSEFKIEKGVPTPPLWSYPLREMEVGDSFLVPVTPDAPAQEIQARVIAASTYNAGQREFTSRREGNGVRVWRIK